MLISLAFVRAVGRERVFELVQQVVVVLDLIYASDQAREDVLELLHAVRQNRRVENMRVAPVTGESLANGDRNSRRPIARLLHVLLAQVRFAAVFAWRTWPQAVTLSLVDASSEQRRLCPAVAPEWGNEA